MQQPRLGLFDHPTGKLAAMIVTTGATKLCVAGPPLFIEPACDALTPCGSFDAGAHD